METPAQLGTGTPSHGARGGLGQMTSPLRAGCSARRTHKPGPFCPRGCCSKYTVSPPSAASVGLQNKPVLLLVAAGCGGPLPSRPPRPSDRAAAPVSRGREASRHLQTPSITGKGTAAPSVSQGPGSVLPQTSFLSPLTRDLSHPHPPGSLSRWRPCTRGFGARLTSFQLWLCPSRPCGPRGSSRRGFGAYAPRGGCGGQLIRKIAVKMNQPCELVGFYSQDGSLRTLSFSLNAFNCVHSGPPVKAGADVPGCCFLCTGSLL